MLRPHLEQYQRLRRAYALSASADTLLVEDFRLDRRRERREQLRIRLETARTHLEQQAVRVIGCTGLGSLSRLRHIDVTDQPDCQSPLENLG